MSVIRTVGIRVVLTGLVGLSLGLISCMDRPKTDEERREEIRQKSAEATASIKQGAKETAAQAKVAAADAGRTLGAVAAGVKDGLQSGKTRIDLNTAPAEKLAVLPGISERKARQIVKSRPYGSSHDLVAKGLLSESQYERISPQVTAR